jgi:phosphoribosylformylglycinamidine (FGAM) synthase-like enzyme
MVEQMSRLWKIKMLRTLIAVLIPSLVLSSQAMSQSFEQFERASQFERAMAVVGEIRDRKKLQCLISVGNRSLCECLSTRLPFTLHISNYVSIANQDKGSADYGQLSAADRQTVDQCVADSH